MHNLLELVIMGELCGFCLFSMRLVVFLDLIGTLTMPATFIYLVYLIVVAATKSGPLPIISIAMLACVYGLQAIVFIIKRQWQHIGWMFIYIAAFPFFGFFIPMYSFWHFDDFSWGNTRVVAGAGKKQIIVDDDEPFDEKMIPMKRWGVYEEEVLERQTANTQDTWGTRITIKTTRSRPGDGGSLYNSQQGDSSSVYGDPSHDGTTVYGGSVIADSFDYYRDTNILHDDRSSRRSRTPGPHLTGGLAPSITSAAPSEYGDFASKRGSRHNLGPDAAHGYRGSVAGSDFELIGSRLSRPGSRQSLRPSVQMVPLVPVGSPLGPDMPTEQMLTDEIKNILSTANLMALTKRQVREQLSSFFGVDLGPHKDYVNSRIEMVLQKKV